MHPAPLISCAPIPPPAESPSQFPPVVVGAADFLSDADRITAGKAIEKYIKL